MREYRCGENPARWRGHLDHVLPARFKVRKVKHHAALPYSEIGTFMASLREREAVAARALEFAHPIYNPDRDADPGLPPLIDRPDSDNPEVTAKCFGLDVDWIGGIDAYLAKHPEIKR